MMDAKERSSDKAAQEMIARMAKAGQQNVWDRLEAQLPQCGFGKQGVCCRICVMGPCRISKKAPLGVCGANADTIAARNLVRMIASGSAAHSDHGRDVAHTLLMVAEGKTADYEIKDETKLRALAVEYGIATEGKSKKDLAKAVAETAFAEFGQQHGALRFLSRAPKKRQEIWKETMHS